MRRIPFLSIFFIATVPIFASGPACDPENGGLKLPPGFCAEVVADGLGEARQAVAAPNGDVYVALLK
ncbi:MAG TPA: hypothetical protein VKS01_06905, partial [Bryobacteraceae bacterium]|nr:hypothetical protein [Bryobacteraceae bacterium]